MSAIDWWDGRRRPCIARNENFRYDVGFQSLIWLLILWTWAFPVEGFFRGRIRTSVANLSSKGIWLAFANVIVSEKLPPSLNSCSYVYYIVFLRVGKRTLYKNQSIVLTFVNCTCYPRRRISSFHFYRWNQFKVIPYKKPSQIFCDVRRRLTTRQITLTSPRG